jgi:DNA-directed RNA polymerase subunit RPC12/RpoP
VADLAKEVLTRARRTALILGQAIEESGAMVPELTTCDQCGRTVIVLSWAPVYDDAVRLIEVDESHSLSIDCKIDCPACGTRIQGVAPSAIEPA